MRHVVLVSLLLLSACLATGQAPAKHAPIPVTPPKRSGTSLTVVVTDENNVVVPDVHIVLTDNTNPEVLQIHTDAAGRGHFYNLIPEHVFSLSADKENFYTAAQSDLRINGAQTLEIALAHVQELKETVNVTASAQDIDPTQTANTRTLGTPEIINIPYPTSRDIRNILPYLPQVVQDSTGQVHVAGADTYETTDVLDGFEITSPQSGILAMRFSADAVRQIDVQSSRVSTQFGKESGGIIDFTSGMGDDRLRFDATNFIPSFELYKGLDFDKWVPRATVSGPIVKGKAWFFDSADGEYDSNIYKGLPSGNDRDPLWRGSNLAKVQVNLRSTDILTFGLLNNIQDEDRQGLSLVVPSESTVQRDFSSYLADVKELHYFSGGALLETGFAWNAFDDHYRPQPGNAPFVITPNTAEGNYFETFHGTSRRAQGIANLSLKPIPGMGHHEVKVGSEVDQINFTDHYIDTPFSLLRSDSTLERVSALPPSTFINRNNFETSGYIEDRWTPLEHLLIQPGGRLDWDEIVRRPLFSPRIAGTYMLGKTKISGGIGLYYERTHLDYIARAMTGPRLDTYYDNTGTIPLGPPLVTNFFVNESLLEEPRFLNWSVQVEHEFPAKVFGGVEYLQKTGNDGFIFQNLNTSSILSGNYELTNTRVDHYESLQFTARKHFSGDYNMFLSYTRSYAHSNAVVDYSLDNPIFSPQMGGPLPWDVPNKLISWGWFPTPFKRWDFVYAIDYHSGFPWTAVNENQQIVGAANSHRFPAYASLNPGLEVRFTFRGYALALRGVVENVTDRQNPFFVVNDVNATNFGTFGGFAGRSLTARIRFLGRK